jgi:hypothetical protein
METDTPNCYFKKNIQNYDIQNTEAAPDRVLHLL